MNRLRRLVLVAGIVGSAACTKTIVEVLPPQHVPTALRLFFSGTDLSGTSIATVATLPVQLVPRLFDADGLELPLPAAVVFSSNDTNVAVVDAAGLAIARKPGGVLISARIPLGTSELTNSVAVTYTCTGSFGFGISAVITDSLTGAAPSVASRWRVSDVAGTYADSGQGIGGLLSAGERAGTYRVDIVTPGYRDWTANGVVVTRDQCHVKGVALAARLQRAAP